MKLDAFETIQVGDEAELLHTVTEKDVDDFARLTGDDNPLHMDESYAQTTSFRKRVVHGMLTASFISTIIGTRLPGKGALWYEQSLKFLRPVRIGECIRIHAKVLHKSHSQRLLVISTDIFNMDGTKMVEGEAKVKVVEPVKQKSGTAGHNNGAVIVTGSSRGIGAAIAKALAAAGHPVLINYRTREADALKVVSDIQGGGGRAVAIQADVTVSEEVARLVAHALDQFGSLYGVVNNAAPAIRYSAVTDILWEEVRETIDAHVGSALRVSQAVLPYLLEAGAGCIVNISSVYADNVPPAQQCDYVMAKCAMNGLTRSLAVELGPKGVRVNAVAPGMTHTDLIEGVPDKVKMVSKMHTPLRRLAEPDAVADVVVFLFSAAARHIHGSIVRVCGGSVML